MKKYISNKGTDTLLEFRKTSNLPLPEVLNKVRLADRVKVILDEVILLVRTVWTELGTHKSSDIKKPTSTYFHIWNNW